MNKMVVWYVIALYVVHQLSPRHWQLGFVWLKINLLYSESSTVESEEVNTVKVWVLVMYWNTGKSVAKLVDKMLDVPGFCSAGHMQAEKSVQVHSFLPYRVNRWGRKSIGAHTVCSEEVHVLSVGVHFCRVRVTDIFAQQHGNEQQ